MRAMQVCADRDQATTIVSARSLGKSFSRGLARAVRRTVAIDDVDLDIRRGEVTAIVGAESAGKTTLLQCLCGLLKRDSGTVELFGSPLTQRGCPRNVAYVSAVPVFYPFLTVRDVLEFRVARLSLAGRASDCIVRTLKALDLEAVETCRVSSLPRDMLNRVAIAEALAGRPDLILMDTGAFVLDCPADAASVRALWAFADAGAAVVTASRESAWIAPVATRVVVLEEGRIARTFAVESSTVSTIAAPATRLAGSLFVAERIH